jgi:hypothetical protein
MVRIVANKSGDHSLKIQGFIGIVALQGSSALSRDRIDTGPYIPETFDRVLRKDHSILVTVLKLAFHSKMHHSSHCQWL